MESVLIDTDVLLDFFFDRKPHAEYTAEVLKLCEKRIIKGFVSPVIVANAYYLLRKTAKHQTVINSLTKLLRIIDVVEMNREVVINALGSEFKDFEDALQNYSAVQHRQINVVLTRNVKDFKHSQLIIFTPELYLKSRA